MSDFILWSIIASVVLTLLLNLFPLLFPSTAARAQRRMEEHARRMIEQHEDDQQPRMKVFFPWKTMLIVSIALTLLVNLISWISN